MTYLEKVLSENPQMKSCEVMEEKCPSDFGYEDSKGTGCGFSLELDCCIKCWNREVPEVVDVSMLVEKYNEGLNDGRNEAWELVKKMILLDNDTAREVFGTGFLKLAMENLTPQEALAKLKAYEEAQSKIEVGDVVELTVGTKGVVTSIRNDIADGFTEAGFSFYDLPLDELKKTGKHIDISSILEQIGE